jgi:hypothetical protein
MSLAFAVLALALSADDALSLEKQAQLERDQEKAQAEVAKRYGNKKSSELTPEERKQMIKDQAAAEREVLEKNGIDPKQAAREAMKRDRADYARQKELVKELGEKEKAAKEAAEQALKKAKEAGEVLVQRGISEENPVTLEEKEGEDGKVAVEKGLPPELESDQAAAAEQDRLEKSGDATDAPAPKASKGGGRGKRR